MKFSLYYFQITVSRTTRLKSSPRCAVGRCYNMARLWLYIATLEESSCTNPTPRFLSFNLQFLHGKECGSCSQWPMGCHQQEISGFSGSCFLVMVGSTSVMMFLGWQASLKCAGQSACWPIGVPANQPAAAWHAWEQVWGTWDGGGQKNTLSTLYVRYPQRCL